MRSWPLTGICQQRCRQFRRVAAGIEDSPFCVDKSLAYRYISSKTFNKMLETTIAVGKQLFIFLGLFGLGIDLRRGRAAARLTERVPRKVCQGTDWVERESSMVPMEG